MITPEIKNDLPFDFWRREIMELSKLLFSNILRSLLKSARSSINFLESIIGFGIDYSLIADSALAYARTHSLLVAEKVIDGTRRVVEKEIQNWIAGNQPLPDLIDNLVNSGLFDPYRAKMIATTEITNAYAKGNQLAWEESGVVSGKIWMTANDEKVCPECGALAENSVALLNSFQAGEGFEPHETPPAHVNCRCWMKPEVIKRKEILQGGSQKYPAILFDSKDPING